VVSGFDKRGTNYENVWEHGNIGQYWKGTREQGPPLGDPQTGAWDLLSCMCSEPLRLFHAYLCNVCATHVSVVSRKHSRSATPLDKRYI